MKLLENIKKLSLFIILQFICILGVNAASVTYDFTGVSSANVGDEITITLALKNISGGPIVAGEGNLSFDDSYLKYISGTPVSGNQFSYSINTGYNYKIAGMDITMTGINSNANIFTFKFKALKEGTTTVTLKNAQASNAEDIVSSPVNAKTITIGNSSSTGSTNATLKSLGVTGLSLSPAFNKDTTNYTVKVPSGTNSVSITGDATEDKASIKGLGNLTLSGSSTTKEIVVTAPDGKTTKTYKITFTKEGSDSKSSDNTLKSLSVSGYTLNPTFKPSTTSYTINVANTVTGLNVSAVPNNSKAKVTVTGNKSWKVGVNTITIKVTAENGNIKNYTVNVIRADEKGKTPDDGKDDEGSKSDATLKSLEIKSAHTIDKKFDKDTTSYAITVPNEVEKLDLSYVTNNPKAKVTVTGNEGFKVGEAKSVIITVTAEDGTTKYYILNVTRNSNSSGTDIKDIDFGKDVIDIDPEFDPDKTEYTVTIGSNTDSIDFSKVAVDKDSKLEVIGNEDLKDGSTVLLKVTDKDGMQKYYTFKVKKETSKGFLGISGKVWGILLGVLGFLILFWLLLLLLIKRRKEKEETKEQKPIIEFKPEFNFGSKNTSDDDTVHGNFNQASEIEYKGKKDLIDYDDDDEDDNVIEAEVKEIPPYDPYDATITKDEIVDAIHEAVKTNDASKLKMLLDQDELNHRKKKMKQKEEEKNKKNRRDDYDE